MNNACPNCGGIGPNLNCPNHVFYTGNMTNPCKEIPLPQPIDRVHALERERDLFAEIGRLNVLLNERNKEIERLRGGHRPKMGGGHHPKCVWDDCQGGCHDLFYEYGEHLSETASTDQFGRILPLEGHHKDCGHGKDGWSLCTCDELKKADEERASKQFKDLLEEGQNLRKEFDKQTAGMRGPPKCSKCGDTGLVQVTPNARGVKQCECKKYGPHHPECGRAKPGMRSPCNCLGLYERDARNQRNLDQIFDDLMEDDEETCEHGNAVCKRCGVGQPTIKTPEGKPLLPPAEFSSMRIEDNRERDISECNFQRQTGRTTAMVLKALEFVKENAMGGVVIEVDGNRMKAHVRALLKHYADETGVNHRQLARIFVKPPGMNISGIDVGLELRDNVFDDTKENKPTRDPRQDLKVGDIVRFEITGVITDRQTGGIVKDYDGNDYEPVQYEIKDRDKRITNYIPYDKIINVIGKEE